MLSMTAFARVSEAQSALVYTWELRSVNNRFLDIQIRLPESLKSYEPVYRDMIRQRLHRGKVDVVLYVEQAVTAKKSRINTEQLFHYSTLLEEINAVFPNIAPIDPLALLALPNMLIEASSILTSDDVQCIQDSLGVALDQLLLEKLREGSALQSLIQNRVDSALSHLIQLQDQLEHLMSVHIANLKQKVQLIAPNLDESRWVQEIAIIAQRADIAEELERLTVHLTDVKRLLQSTEPVGRKLDFLMQELNREANTLGSKSIGLDVTQVSLAIKVLIEQMREQIQNVE